jgi:hypothetical protein
VSTTFQIDGVRTARPPGYTHEHITHVRLATSGVVLRRETVIRDLRTYGGDRYYTYANGTRADVIVAGCPNCGYGDYITTAPDRTTTNNLLSLPRI